MKDRCSIKRPVQDSWLDGGLHNGTGLFRGFRLPFYSFRARINPFVFDIGGFNWNSPLDYALCNREDKHNFNNSINGKTEGSMISKKKRSRRIPSSIRDFSIIRRIIRIVPSLYFFNTREIARRNELISEMVVVCRFHASRFNEFAGLIGKNFWATTGNVRD